MSHAPLTLRTDLSIWVQSLTLLVAGAWLLIAPTHDAYLLALGCFTAVGVIGLLRCILRARSITIWDLMLVSLGLGYGLGTLNTELNWIHSALDYWALTAASPAHVMRVSGWLLLLGALISAVSGLDRRPILMDAQVVDSQLTLAASLVGVTALAAAILVAMGTIGYHADVTDGGVSVSPMAAIVISAICPAAALGCFILPRLKGSMRWVLWIALCALLLIQLYQGRRVFIYTLVICLMFLFDAWSPKKLLTWRTLFSLALAFVCIVGASKVFYALRMAVWELGSAKDTVALFTKGKEILFDQQRSGLDEAVSDNQDSRTFIVGYPAALLQALDQYDPLYGDLIKFDAALSVPTVLWPGKHKVIAIGFEEALANPHFGLPIIDEANSIVTAGLSDFGVAGLFIYPVVLLLIYRLVLDRVRTLGGLPYLVVAVIFINTLFNVEAATADYFNAIRSVLILGAMCIPCIFAWQVIFKPFQPQPV